MTAQDTTVTVNLDDLYRMLYETGKGHLGRDAHEAWMRVAEKSGYWHTMHLPGHPANPNSEARP